ncbi:MAG: hypothetical protein MJ066_01070 [Clostridia bacterium]|nr:hypothetical protein [Clostridia bacterium]
MYYIKNSLFSFCYVIFSSVIAFGISLLKSENWIKIILLTINLLLFLVINFVLFNHHGIEGAKTMFANDLQRKEIIRTGKDLPLKEAEEYKVFKGFLMGVIVCAPLIIMLLIQSLIWIIGGEDASRIVGGIGVGLYFNFFAYFSFKDYLSIGSYYLSLFLVPLVSAFCGIGYIYGGNKVISEKERIRKKQKEIYGE